MVPRPCIEPGCRAYGEGARCPAHTAARSRERNASRPQYRGDWAARRLAVLERDGYVCWKCGGPANTVDHVLPVAKGGTNDLANLAAACGPCNFGAGGSVRRK